MTTQSWSAVIDHTSDAGFRAWGADFSAKLAAVGLIQTTDTGQINWVTVTRPGTNTTAGYEIWRMNDTQQGTAPVYFRFDYGTGLTATGPRIQVTVGTGSNGAGTLTGTALTTARSCTVSVAPTSTAIAYQSYMCAVNGFFGFAWKMSGQSANIPMGCFLFTRSCDTSGTPSATGAIVLWCAGATSAYTAYQFLRFAATAVAYTARTNVSELPFVVPGEPVSSLVGADNQAYLWWMAVPNVLPVLGWCQIIRAEAGTGSTFTVALIGSTARTYVAIGQPLPGNPASNANYGVAMLWE